MKAPGSLALSAVSVATVACVAIFLSPGAIRSTSVRAASAAPGASAASDASQARQEPRLVGLSVEVLEASALALETAGVRLSDIRGGTPNREQAPRLLGSAETASGTRPLADFHLTTVEGTTLRVSGGLEEPTRTSTLSGGGVSTSGFGGYERGGVRLEVTPLAISDGRIRLDITYDVSEFDDPGASADTPPARTRRSGSFTTRIASGELRVFGGMMRAGRDASYLLFFVEPEWLD